MIKRLVYYKLGLAYFFLMFVLYMFLPKWVADENLIIENLQLLWLAAGLNCCCRAKKHIYKDWLGDAKALWSAGMVYFFLLFMREISWGRTLISNPDGSMIQYSQMGLYGMLVHPLVVCLLILLLALLYKACVWRMLRSIDFPFEGFLMLILFIYGSWVAEKGHIMGFYGQVAEELAELGAYMMMYFLLNDVIYQLKIK